MLTLLSILSGMLISIMVAQNGALSEMLGNYRATVIVHGVGLIAILLWMLIRKQKFSLQKGLPWYDYLGGSLGVLNVVFTNLCFPTLGVSVTLALGLLGQAAVGAVIDHFGLLGFQRLRFRKEHILSFGLIVAGILVMMLA